MIEEKLKEWKKIRDEIGELFQQRKRNDAKPLMIQSFGEYELLKKVMEESLHEKNFELLNERERVDFIRANVDHYHAYIQLKELYNELEKIYYKKKAMKKER